MSNACTFGFSPAAGVFFAPSCTFAVKSAKPLLSFSAADLLIKSVTHAPNLRYGLQKAWLIEMGLSMIFVTTASQSLP